MRAEVVEVAHGGLEGDLELARQDGEVGVAAGGEEFVDAAKALGGLTAAAP